MRLIISLVILAGLSLPASSQPTNDSLLIHRIYSEALTDGTAYRNLEYLCTRYPGRICGSQAAAGAVEWCRQLLENMKFDTVYMQPVKVRRWDRGDREVAQVTSAIVGEHNLSVCAVGWSAGTGSEGIKGRIVEVRSKEELKNLGRGGISGKIVFFDQAFDPTHYYTFEAYGETVWQRARGADMAAYYGAKAILVRSLTMANDDSPHTGIMHYSDTVARIPALAVSPAGSDSLSLWLRRDPGLELFLRTTSKEYPEEDSYNIIAEIRGTEKPKEVIAVGGHIDAWDNTQGAHDDGIGVIQSIEVLRILKNLGIRPRHTVRAVIFMDEEVAQRGAAAYAASVGLKNEKHLAALETDRGGFTPYGFSIDAADSTVARIREWRSLLEPYGIWSFKKGGSGVDVRDLKPYGIPLLALVTDSQRYFDYQHAVTDTWDQVHPRELQLGSATLASLIVLIDSW